MCVCVVMKDVCIPAVRGAQEPHLPNYCYYYFIFCYHDVTIISITGVKCNSTRKVVPICENVVLKCDVDKIFRTTKQNIFCYSYFR